MSNKLTVFSADWCGNCGPFKKQLETLGIKFDTVDTDTDEGLKLTQQYNIRSLPSVVIKSPEEDILLIDSGTGCLSKVKELMLV